jgi:hypothetical protein
MRADRERERAARLRAALRDVADKFDDVGCDEYSACADMAARSREALAADAP